VVIVPGKVLCVDEQVMVSVQLPELAVDDVEMLVGEELGQLVDVRLLLQECYVLQSQCRRLSTGPVPPAHSCPAGWTPSSRL
jgi:hypothetical protein